MELGFANALTTALTADDDDDENMLLILIPIINYFMECYEFQTPRPRRPRIPPLRYSFRNSQQDPRELFRFTANEIKTIARLMNEPYWHHTACRDKFSLIEGICILCRRLCYPARWNDLTSLFGRSAAPLCRIFNYMLDIILRKYRHLLQFDVTRFVNKLPEWADAVATTCPNTYTTVVLFLDGTHRKTCRPKPSALNLPPGITLNDIQRAQYDGHHHKHGFKYHALVSPNGLIVHAYGPVDGRRHDTTILRQSGLADAQFDLSVNGIDYIIYCDSAYALTRNMSKPFYRPAAGTVEARVNTTMARARTVASECGYSTITRMWTTTDFPRQQKMFWTRPADMYIVSILLSNIRLCLRRFNQMSEFFNLSDTCPSLENYLRGDWN